MSCPIPSRIHWCIVTSLPPLLNLQQDLPYISRGRCNEHIGTGLKTPYFDTRLTSTGGTTHPWPSYPFSSTSSIPRLPHSIPTAAPHSTNRCPSMSLSHPHSSIWCVVCFLFVITDSTASVITCCLALCLLTAVTTLQCY
jgi:hypothetical protein